jgi:AmiR/NasT family two-component response regulator
MTERVRVLVVEDDYLVAQMICGQLEQIGYEVAGHAGDGGQAIDLACTLQPDVVLLDIQLPRLSGLEVARRIQARCPTPIVMLTAHSGMDLVREASAVGAGAYLVKPPNAREIERAVTIARARFEDLMALRRVNAELEAALAQVKTLRGLLPICAACKKIRDDRGYWHEVEAYVRAHTEAEFTHGICPDCMRKLYPDYVKRSE